MKDKKIFSILLIVIFSSSLIGVSYGLWSKKLQINGSINTGAWKGCIRIRKGLHGAYYNYSQVSSEIDGPTNKIPIAAGYPTYFQFIIEVENCGNVDLKDVEVTDIIKNNVAPVSWEAEKGTVLFSPFPIDYDNFHFDELTWSIGDLNAGKSVKVSIWIQTLPNPSRVTGDVLKYSPTGGDEPDDDRQIIEINGEEESNEPDGATVIAFVGSKRLSATTDGICVEVVDDGEYYNGWGLIKTILPFYTDWARDSKNIY